MMRKKAGERYSSRDARGLVDELTAARVVEMVLTASFFGLSAGSFFGRSCFVFRHDCRLLKLSALYVDCNHAFFRWVSGVFGAMIRVVDAILAGRNSFKNYLRRLAVRRDGFRYPLVVCSAVRG